MMLSLLLSGADRNLPQQLRRLPEHGQRLPGVRHRHPGQPHHLPRRWGRRGRADGRRRQGHRDAVQGRAHRGEGEGSSSRPVMLEHRLRRRSVTGVTIAAAHVISDSFPVADLCQHGSVHLRPRGHQESSGSGAVRRRAQEPR